MEENKRDEVPDPESSRLQFIKNMGEGGFGVAKLFKDKVTDKMYVRKDIQLNGPLQQLLFQRELQMLIRIRQKGCEKHFVCLRNQSYNGQWGYILMDYIPNSFEFHSFLKQNIQNLNWTQRFVIMHRALKALARLHDIGITHRDMKTTNILVDTSLQVYLIDFGLSCFRSDPACYQQTAGTPAFQDPQMARRFATRRDPSVKFSPPTFTENMQNDLWGLGICLAMMFHSRDAFYVKAGQHTREIQANLHGFFKRVWHDYSYPRVSKEQEAIVRATFPILQSIFNAIFIIPLQNRPTAHKLLAIWSTYEKAWVRAIFNVYHRKPVPFKVLKQGAVKNLQQIQINPKTKQWANDNRPVSAIAVRVASKNRRKRLNTVA